ncbi:hypothetical protein MMC13_001427 [Lambiella insularis]|nr:hypothetical protein [Lambiella insularis]
MFHNHHAFSAPWPSNVHAPNVLAEYRQGRNGSIADQYLSHYTQAGDLIQAGQALSRRHLPANRPLFTIPTAQLRAARRRLGLWLYHIDFNGGSLDVIPPAWSRPEWVIKNRDLPIDSGGLASSPALSETPPDYTSLVPPSIYIHSSLTTIGACLVQIDYELLTVDKHLSVRGETEEGPRICMGFVAKMNAEFKTIDRAMAALEPQVEKVMTIWRGLKHRGGTTYLKGHLRVIARTDERPVDFLEEGKRVFNIACMMDEEDEYQLALLVASFMPGAEEERRGWQVATMMEEADEGRRALHAARMMEEEEEGEQTVIVGEGGAVAVNQAAGVEEQVACEEEQVDVEAEQIADVRERVAAWAEQVAASAEQGAVVEEQVAVEEEHVAAGGVQWRRGDRRSRLGAWARCTKAPDASI